MLETNGTNSAEENSSEVNLYEVNPTEENSSEVNLYEVNSTEENSYKANSNGRKKEKKRAGFGGGFVAGLLVACLILVGVFELYANVFGGYLIIGGNGLKQSKPSIAINEETSKRLDELMSYISLYSVDEIDQDKMNDEVCHALVDSLGDKYSAYFTKEEYDEMKTSTTGSYYGIGAGLKQDAKTMEVTVSKIYEGTPSEEAGMLKDDMILMVDDIEATSMELSELVQHIRGEEGTTVHIKLYRPSEEKELEFDVERKNVVLPSVSTKLLEDGIGYIQVSEFQTNTPKQFKEGIEKLQEDGMTKMIIDLRSNPGGLVSSVVEMLDYILPEGIVVYTEDKYGNRTDYTSKGDSHLDLPMVVLVDGNSASASEIFAGAIKDYEYGTILGTKTFGKGIVQSIWPLENGTAIKLTTAKYYTPNGVNIHGIGIEPDITLEYEFLGGEKDMYSVELDNQIQKAIELLK